MRSAFRRRRLFGSGSSAASLWRLGYNYNFTGTYRIGMTTTSSVLRQQQTRSIEPAIGPGSAGAWDEGGVAQPYIINVGGTLYCYFTGWLPGFSTRKIGVATSTDNGATWTKYPLNPILAGSNAWENNFVGIPYVLYDTVESDPNKRWKMWYCGGTTFAGGAADFSVGYAYSYDGFAWTKGQATPVLTKTGAGWEKDAVCSGPVIYYNGSYHIFYEGLNSTNLPLAESGLQWQNGVATFTDPVGTYTRSGLNPVLASDLATSPLSSDVSISATSLVVTSSALFTVGCPVWVFDGTNHYLTKVTAKPDGTHLTVADAAPVAISSAGGNGHVRSVFYSSVIIQSVANDNGTWTAGIVGYEAGVPGTLTEIGALATAANPDSAWAINYTVGAVTPPTLAESRNANASCENPAIVSLTTYPSLTSTSAAYDAAVVADGAIFFAPLTTTSGDSVDTVGGVHVVSGGTVAKTTHGPFQGVAETCWQFDGISGYASAALNLSAYSSITLECWYQWDAYVNNAYRQLYEYTTDYNSANGFNLLPDVNGAPADYYIGQHKTGAGVGYWDDRFRQSKVSAATWHHLMILHDRATPQTKVFVDGVQLTMDSTVAHSMTSAAQANWDNSTLYLASRAGSSLFGPCRMSRLAFYSGDKTNKAAAHYALRS